MKTYTPQELREFANSRGTNPFWHDEAVAALMYAANVLEAAALAVKAERERIACTLERTTERKRILYAAQNGKALQACNLAAAVRGSK